MLDGVHCLVALHEIFLETAEKYLSKAALSKCEEEGETFNADLFLRLEFDELCMFVDFILLPLLGFFAFLIFIVTYFQRTMNFDELVDIFAIWRYYLIEGVP